MATSIADLPGTAGGVYERGLWPELLRQHYRDLFHDPADSYNVQWARVERLWGAVRQEDPPRHIPVGLPLMLEVQSKLATQGTAPGTDDVPLEVLQKLPRQAVHCLAIAFAPLNNFP